MRTQLTLWGALLALAAGFAWLDARTVQADEEGATGVWVYEVRVVRVDAGTKEAAEAPSSIPQLTGTTTKAGWREILAGLKQRGNTTILMDQNITTMPGEKASGRSDRTIPILALNFANRSDEQKRATNVKTGCRLDLLPAPERLQYTLSVQWALAAGKDGDAPELFVAEWNGSHPNLRDETLVLRYREQVSQSAVTRAIEIYGLVTGRFLRK